MDKKNIMWVLALGAAAFSGGVQAADDSMRWYLQGVAGRSAMEDMRVQFDFDVSGTTTTLADENAQYNLGGTYGFALGYRIDSLAIELESTSRSNTLDTYFSSSRDGRVDVDSLMVNLVYTPTSFTGIVKPYLGIGGGLATVNFKMSDTAGTARDSEADYAMQAIAGLSISVTPQWEVIGQYQYFTARDLTNRDSFVSGATSSNIYEVKDNYYARNLSVGVRYNF